MMYERKGPEIIMMYLFTLENEEIKCKRYHIYIGKQSTSSKKENPYKCIPDEEFNSKEDIQYYNQAFGYYPNEDEVDKIGKIADILISSKFPTFPMLSYDNDVEFYKFKVFQFFMKSKELLQQEIYPEELQTLGKILNCKMKIEE